MRRPLPRPLLLVVGLGAAFLVAGIVLLIRTGLAPDHIGWFAYAPLSDVRLGGPGDTLVIVRPGTRWGLALAVVGGLAVSGAVGYALGSRRRATTAS